uniref:Uncharacterized protein n=1 Tax=Utricularia reniformis TaxID=192314 RepID=A0A1Y0AZA2_9LAMI|nr:hypothetical protein AEK19_MT0233 [Utricularia reniformis]ART30512.1 hypothetical protein AEK19_MT0233 [Utricularia reniformis]
MVVYEQFYSSELRVKSCYAIVSSSWSSVFTLSFHCFFPLS